ncbi:cell adhesion molecule 3-like isoform X2 [Pundamilia nyererei]|nr:PREDICTED: cell adhesion molecule 3-like isoform X2 [Pundamilia nyererei]XP_005749985.1 PREDICTED: cell adhesion molecule 3-like isoform X2 [Pundamilia nyererei]
MGWESTHQGVDLTQGVTSLPFKIDSVPEWKMEPMCYVNSRDGDQCTKTLPVTVYKMPDSVSLNYSLTKVEEGQKYYIQCDIANVAPARNLSVLWLKGNTIIKLETFNESSLSPVSKSSVLTLTAHRDDDGAEIWCEPKLNLWPEEQGPPSGPPVRSVKHNLTVLYPPTFNKLEDETLEMTVGENMTLNCNAKGNPPPSYRWEFPKFTKEWRDKEEVIEPILTLPFELPGVYTCTAYSNRGNVTKYFNISEAPRSRTTFGVMVGVGVAVGVLLLIAGAYFVAPNGTFSFNKGGYQPGTPSGPV